MNFFQETEKECAIEDSALLEAIRAKAAMSIALLAVGTVAVDALFNENATKEELVEYIKQMYNIVCVGCAIEEKANSVVH